MATPPLSEYERKRQQQIAANQAKLLSLGIEPIGTKKNRRKIPGQEEKVDVIEKPINAAPRRTSLRLLRMRNSLEQADMLTAIALIEEQERNFERAKRRAKRARLATATTQSGAELLNLPLVDESAVKAESTTIPIAPRKKISSALLDIDLDSFHSRWLGKQIWPRGKQTIMQGVCPQHIPVFSKMSGIQAWNNAILLFVNVQGESMYNNVFHQREVDGKQTVCFQWFAQNRQHPDTPVIWRLVQQSVKGHQQLRFDDSYDDDAIHQGNQEEDQTKTSANGSVKQPVLLFIRDVEGPYIYCGRLGYLGFRPTSQPLEFRWQLLDVDAMDWETIRSLIDASSKQVDDAAVVENVAS